MGQKASSRATLNWWAKDEVQRLCQMYGTNQLKRFLSGSYSITTTSFGKDISKHRDPAIIHTCCQFIVLYSNDHDKFRTLMEQHCAIARILVNILNVDVTVEDSFNKNALHYLVRSLHYPSLEDLALDMLHKDLDVNASDYRGRTPLHVSTFTRGSYRPKPIDISWDLCLIKHGANVNKKDFCSQEVPIKKITRARWTADWDQLVVIHLKAGLNLAHLSSDDQKKMLTRAFENFDVELVLCLAEAGGKMYAPDDDEMLTEWKTWMRVDLPELRDRVLPLQRLAANVIRVSLWPNAIVGVKALEIPKHLTNYITFHYIQGLDHFQTGCCI